MSRDDLARFEAGAGDLLEALGYERATSPGAKQLERAGRIRSAFVAQLRSRRRPRPNAWSSAARAASRER
jgi:hypothetical protein